MCDGQILHINEYKAAIIYICGFCTYGHYADIFLIEYGDGTVEKLDVLFSDMCWPLSDFEGFNYEQVNYKKASHVFLKRTRQIGEKICPHIFYNTFMLNPKKTIKKIIFPNNDFINVFGITLEEQ